MGVDDEEDMVEKKSNRVGLFQLWKEIIIAKRQIRELENVKQELRKSFAMSKETSDPVERLKYLDTAEENFIRAKTLLYQIKDRQTNLFKHKIDEEDIITDIQLEEMEAYISGLKLITKIAVESYINGNAPEKWAQLLAWFGIDSPTIEMAITVETIEQKRWKVLTVKDDQYRPVDNMPPSVIKRQQGMRKVFERGGGRFSYQADPSFGTQIIFMIPSKYD